MGKKDAGATKLPVDQYRKQIGKFSHDFTQNWYNVAFDIMALKQ